MGTLFIIIIIGAIIYIVIDFNKNKSNKYSVAKREQKSDELVEGKDDIEDYISGYEYRANYWTPYTSLEALNHHRKILRKIKESELPNYGDGLRSHGVWLPFVDNLKPDEPSNEELQDIEFLKKFRETYESDLLHDEKYKIISVLCEEYKDLPLAQNSKNWYLWNLCEISGISESIAEDLYFKGYKSKHDIKKISEGYLFHPAFNGHWGNEDRFMGNCALKLGLKYIFDFDTVLNGTMEYTDDKRKEYDGYSLKTQIELINKLI